MRITEKVMYDYFEEYVKPIAPNLVLNTVNEGWRMTIKDGDRLKRNVVYNATGTEMISWMVGFVNSYNYFRGEL